MRIADIAVTVVLGALLVATPPTRALSQEQEAGNEASVNAEETFQRLIEQCDNTDVLVLRARVRLLQGRTTEEAAAQSQTLLDEGLAQCGEGDIETASATLNEAIQVAEAGTDEALGTATQDTAAADDGADGEVVEAAAEEGDGAEEEDRPWWRFW